MINRGKCDAELERELEVSPFETYELFRGQKFGGASGEGDYRVVGNFKVRRPKSHNSIVAVLIGSCEFDSFLFLYVQSTVL